jgi:hypothetical protein
LNSTNLKKYFSFQTILKNKYLGGRSVTRGGQALKRGWQ